MKPMANGCIHPAARTASRTRQRAAGAACSLLLSVGLLAALWGRTINHDTAWYLVSTRKWLEGATLYVDLYDVNPPLATYLTVPAILLSDAFAIGDTNGQYALLAGLTCISLFWSWSILIDRVVLGTRHQGLALFGLGAVLTVPALPEIGQREHLMVLFTLPWCLGQLPVRDGDARGRRAGRILRAVVAALGICLKPYFLTLPVAVVLWQGITRRSLRPLVTIETMAMLATGVLFYVASARVLHPDYFTEVIPTARQVYLSFGYPGDYILDRLVNGVTPYLPFLLLLFARGWRGGPNVPMTGLLAAGTMAGLASYVWQWNGFDYHFIPFWSFAALAVLWALLAVEWRTPLGIAAVLTAGMIVALAVDRGTYDFRARPFVEAAMGGRPPPRSLFVATTSVDAGPLLALELGADWVSRYPQNWLVPGALGRLDATDCAATPEACAELRAILAKNRDDNIADIERARPEMIIIDKRRGFVPTDGFSWYDFYAGNPRWDSVIAPYTLVGSTANFDTWSRAGTDG